MIDPVRAPSSPVRLGLAVNWRQFAVLVLVNAFVGAMVGLERAALPLVAAHDFGIASAAAALSFIAAFGLAKALSNAAAGILVQRWSRRAVLIGGWLLALPVPIMILKAPSWSWIVAANALLGMNQGFAWSATVIMKIDLVGPKQRGLALGLNEVAGYVAVAVAAVGSGLAITSYGLRAGPAYAGIAVATLGLLLSVFAVRDTTGHARFEERSHQADDTRSPTGGTSAPGRWRPNRQMVAISQAGLVNNLNDGLAWGLFPLFFAASGIALRTVTVLVAIYPAVWGICQLWTGPLSDRVGRRVLIVSGMTVQGGALIALALTHGPAPWIAALVALGIGTALVYPTLLAAVGDAAPPSARGTAVGFYRFWRDLGYCVGAVLAGQVADALGIPVAIAAVGALTMASGALFGAQFREIPLRDR